MDPTINKVITAFETYALGDIHTISKMKKPIATFILAFCFIDQLSLYAFDSAKKGLTKGSDRQKKFVSEYLNKVAQKPYDPIALIDTLRNRLVHNYSLVDLKPGIRPRYLLSWLYPELHLHIQSDCILLDITGFTSDLKAAWYLYKEQLLINPELQKLAFRQVSRFGIVTEMKINIE